MITFTPSFPLYRGKRRGYPQEQGSDYGGKIRRSRIFLVMNRDGSQIFVQGHPEYDRMTLNNEYHRDLKKGLNPAIPVNYYVDNDPFSVPPLMWRSTANMLYTNWLNFYVYQTTPYILEVDDSL